ncbi:MAG: hypothetical protein ACREJX_09320, partial [Polyangiaceae bacterium]
MRARGAGWALSAFVLIACVGDEPATVDGGATDGGVSDGSAIACTTSQDCPATAATCTAGTCSPCAATQTPSDCATFHPATPVCNAAGACVECNSTGADAGASPDCASKTSTPFCGPNDTCVACLTANDCTPQVCGTDNTCRDCQTNAECPAGACGDDGKCVPGSMIAYVDNGAMSPATCSSTRLTKNGYTIATAFCDITDAVGAKPYIVVIGRGATAPYSAIINLGGTTTIIGPGGSASPPAVIGGSLAVTNDNCGIGTCLVKVTNPAATPGAVTVDGFEITSTNGSIYGVECSANAASQSFRLRNSYIHDVHGDALYNTKCDLTIEDNQIAGTDTRAVEDFNSGSVPTYVIERNVFGGGGGDGVYVTTANLTFDRNVVSNYTNGAGLQVNGGTYRVTNSFFFLNKYGLDFNISAGPGQVFQFNTVVRNTMYAFQNCPALLESSIVVENIDAPN